MPIFLTWEYGVSVAGALVVVLLVHRTGVRYGLTIVATAAIVGFLWLMGRHPLGFLVSRGGWVMFGLTVIVAKTLALLVSAFQRPSARGSE